MTSGRRNPSTRKAGRGATRARSATRRRSKVPPPETPIDLSAFARRVGREAERRGFGLAKRQVVVGDGAPWWNVTAEQFPEAIEIVDLYHAQEKIWDASKALHAGARHAFGSGPKRVARPWPRAVWMTFWQPCGPEPPSVSKCVSAPTISSAIATGCSTRLPCPRTFRRFRCRRGRCKTTIGARLKRAGALVCHGANTIIALRYLSGRFEDFWERRSVDR